MVITIDGPGASGKSSVAKVLAKRLNIYYLYTGLLYRAVGYILAQTYGEEHMKATCTGPFKVDPDDLYLVQEIEYAYPNGAPQISFQGKDITAELSKPHIDQLASIVSANKDVRDALLDLQRSIGKKHDIIADGRDCGTVVFPDAEYKFFLTASLEVRAKRLFDDPDRKGKERSLEDIQNDLAERDERDKNRAIAPLKVPEDAMVIDNSDLSREETIDVFVHAINR